MRTFSLGLALGCAGAALWAAGALLATYLPEGWLDTTAGIGALVLWLALVSGIALMVLGPLVVWIVLPLWRLLTKRG